MKLEFKENKKLPVLAWLLEINTKDNTYLLEHGSNVEIGDNYFIEGGWDGRFSDLNFDKSFFFCGTGGKIVNNELIISTPNHTQERICLFKKSEFMLISNSLPFLMERCELSLCRDYYNYDSDFQKVLDGINGNDFHLKTVGGGNHIRLFYYCNIIFDDKYNITVRTKNEDMSFTDFYDYKNKLIMTLERFKDNVIDDIRKTKYGMITTISKGYDAPACAALVKEIGCNEAITFNKPEKYENDSGKDIAKKLGYATVIEENAAKYLKNEDLVEVEYISSGELGTGIVFSAFDDMFTNKVVFMGERGDKVWSKTWSDVNDDFRFKNEMYTGTSHIESKLRIGYIYCPIPLFGAFKWSDIDKITQSEEMSKYSIGGRYDRPIPRRILEDKGVPRDWFGKEKMGAGFNYRFDNKSRLKSRMSLNTYNAFVSEYRPSRSIRRVLSIVKYIFLTKELYLNYIAKKLHIKYRFKSTDIRTTHPGTPNDLFLWSMDKMKEKYKI